MGWEDLANPENVGMALLMGMAIATADTGIIASVFAELSMFLFSSSLFLFSSAITKPKTRPFSFIAFLLSSILSMILGFFSFPLIVMIIAVFAVFIYAFTRARDSWEFPLSISLVMSIPPVYAASIHHSIIWSIYSIAFASGAFSLLLRLQIRQSFMPGEVHNMATKYGIVRAKSVSLWGSIVFSLLSFAVSVMSSPVVAVMAGMSIVLMLLPARLGADASFYISSISLLLFSAIMVVI